MDIEKKIKELIEQTIIKAGYQIEDILYVIEEGQQFLRIIIDKEGMLEVEDCVIVSKLINPILDENDPIEENYILDVCSKEKGCDELE